jgi:peroxiredoxin (alkyl hydroperoxide reductase subunit C)
VVLAISIDSPFTHKVWQEGELSKMIPGGLPYPMLSDTGGRVGELYGVYDEDNGVDIRGRFLIDPDGILQAMEVLAPAVGRNVAEMIRQLRACRFVRETGESTPAGWEPGKKSLKPGEELVGKVCEIWSPDMAF